MLVFAYLPMTSLLSWRATCHDNYVVVNVELRASLLALVARFLPDPTLFLQMLIPWSALIVGEAALSHVLQELSVCNSSLEIAVGNLYFKPFLRSLSRFLPLGTVVDTSVVKNAPPGFAYHRHITRFAQYRLMSGMFIVVYESSTPSACDVVSGYWTTALMNFVTPRTIGCAYPRLTLNNCAVLCDTRLSTMDWADHAMKRTLDRLGFESAYGSRGWPLHARGPSSTRAIIEDCGRTLYVCPHQGRFFGDRGSLVLFCDGFSVDFKEIRQMSVAPYGLMVAWRLPCSIWCEGNCIMDTTVLPAYVLTMLTMFAVDCSPYERSRPVVHTISDAHDLKPTVTPPVSTRGRRYSI